jgi:hypothetical protein
MSSGDGKPKASADDGVLPKGDKGKGGIHNKFRNKQKQKEQKSQAGYSGNSTPKFDGECEELKGHIYDCPDGKNLDQYVKTTKVIAGYVARHYKNGPSLGATFFQVVATVVVVVGVAVTLVWLGQLAL